MTVQGGHGSGRAYFSLFAFSTISAVVVAVAILMIAKPLRCSEMCIDTLFIVLGSQCGLVILGTIFVLFFHKNSSDQDNRRIIHPIIRLVIPLIFNILGVNSLLVNSYINNVQYTRNADKTRLVSNANFTQNFAFTAIKQQKLLREKRDNGKNHFTYNATLQAENKTGVLIDRMIFDLSRVDQVAHPGYNESSFGVDGYWGWQTDGIRMPIGNSEIEVNVEFDEYDLTCEKLKQPLTLVYSLDDDYSSAYKSILIGDSINHEMKQIACGSSSP